MLITIPAAAAMLQCHEETVRRAIRRGSLPVIKTAAVDYCRRVYPSVQLIPERCRVPHTGIADAVCIATYGRLAHL